MIYNVPEQSVPDELLTRLYEGNGLFTRIIDSPAEEAASHGFELDGLANARVRNFYQEALDYLDWENHATTAIKWARLFGGSMAVMLINDGHGLEEPLDWKNIRSIDDIRVYDRSQIRPDADGWTTLEAPDHYHIFSKHGDFTVHESRCLLFRNGTLPERTSSSIYQFWGIPECVRIHQAIQDTELSHHSAVKMLDRSVQPVYKMKGLASELATETGEDRVLRRLQTIDMARSMLGTIAIDSEGEDYDFKSFQFPGVGEATAVARYMLCAVSGIPYTILFGRSITGLKGTDDTTMENYYNLVECIQKQMLHRNLYLLLSVIFRAGLNTGKIVKGPTIRIKFRPLWSLSEQEQATVDLARAQAQLTRAETARTYADMGAITAAEVRKTLASSRAFNPEAIRK